MTQLALFSDTTGQTPRPGASAAHRAKGHGEKPAVGNAKPRDGHHEYHGEESACGETGGAALLAPAPGRGGRSTSREAYHALRDSGALGNVQREVLNFLRAAGKDLTRAELVAGTGLTSGCVCARVDELRKAGLIVEATRRRCTVTTKSAMPLKVSA